MDSQGEADLWAQSSTWCSVTTQRGEMGWEVGGASGEETYVYLWLIHVVV